jgi:DNA-directed RNA polymerase subunit E'/Rpb7
MESTAFFEKKISLTPSDFNEVKTTPIEEILLRKARESVENNCSEQGFVLPGSLQLLSRSMGYFESARFTGDAIYYVKLQGTVIYPVDGIRVKGEVIRKNKMGLYVDYKQAIRIQVPRDLHIGMIEYENVKIGDIVEVELKRSKFAINDSYILASGIFHASVDSEKQAEVALPAAKVQSNAVVEEPAAEVEEEPVVEVEEESAPEESEPEEVEEESEPEESESEAEEASEE